jgi:tocopherol cyclase
MLLKLYNPEIFQGNLHKTDYFEGYYFKQVSLDLESIYSFIPGVSLSVNDRHAFIQVINGITGETEYITFPAEEFRWDKKKLYLRIGDSIFTDSFIDLNINGTGFKITGRIDFSNIVRYPGSLFSPGIMGWYSFVPYMECKHGIVSVNHDLRGTLDINGAKVSFKDGSGYIEKDWGNSFPEAWIWIQSNNFSDRGTSFTFSLAKIPWLGRYFMGFISFLYVNGKFFLFSTYNNSVITEIRHDTKSVTIQLKNRYSVLRVKAEKNSFGELRAPVSGNMSRRIKESIDSTIYLTLHDKAGKLIYEDSGKRAGLEVIEEIFNMMDTNMK